MTAPPRARCRRREAATQSVAPPARGRMPSACSGLELPLELVEEAKIAALRDQLVGARFDHARFVQPQRAKPLSMMRCADRSGWVAQRSAALAEARRMRLVAFGFRRT